MNFYYCAAVLGIFIVAICYLPGLVGCNYPKHPWSQRGTNVPYLDSLEFQQPCANNIAPGNEIPDSHVG